MTPAELTQGRRRRKQEVRAQAGMGRFPPHQAFLIPAPLRQLDPREHAVERVSGESAQPPADEQAALELRDTIRGVGQRAAEISPAEVGTVMARFPSAKH